MIEARRDLRYAQKDKEELKFPHLLGTKSEICKRVGAIDIETPFKTGNMKRIFLDEYTKCFVV